MQPHPPRAFRGGGRRISLTQASFRDSPVFVDQPDTVVVLEEDVLINWTRTPPPDASPFHLGWFGAIIVRASRVHIDLGGHTIGMDEAYRLHQRFFAVIELSNTPLPKGKGGFTTAASAHDDLVVRNGRIDTTSHHCIHAVTAGSRWLIEDLVLTRFEVGAIAISGGGAGSGDITVRRCEIGHALRPVTTSDEVMIRDLARSCDRAGARSVAREMRALQKSMENAPVASDALVRCIVIMPHFNVGRPRKAEPHERLRRILVHDITFEDIRAAPVEVIALKGSDGQPLKDVNGNLIAHSDAAAGNRVARTQALVTPTLPRHVRTTLLHGPYNGDKVFGFDRRGHQMLEKASLYLRIDGATGVQISNLICGTVQANGAHGAAVGLMLNDCRDCRITGVHVDGVRVTDQSVSELSDLRPQSGMYIRGSSNVSVTKFHYGSEDACSCSLRDVHGATLGQCAMAAPMTCLRTSGVRMDAE